MGDSYGLRVTVPSSTDFDPTAPTAVDFKITKPDGTALTWAGVIASQGVGSLEATYAFNADGDDLNAVGTWKAWLQFTVAGESPGPRSEVFSFAVIAADAT